MIKKILLAVLLAAPMCLSAQTLKFGTVNTQEVFNQMPDKATAENTLKETAAKYDAEGKHLLNYKLITKNLKLTQQLQRLSRIVVCKNCKKLTKRFKISNKLQVKNCNAHKKLFLLQSWTSCKTQSRQ